MKGTACVLVALLCVAGPARADCKLWPRLDSFHLDQDLFAPGNEDRNYTMGLRFGWTADAARSHCWVQGTYPLHAWLDRMSGAPHGEGTSIMFSLGNSAFTPDDLRASAVIEDDRPYASLLYASTQYVTETVPGRAAEGASWRSVSWAWG